LKHFTEAKNALLRYYSTSRSSHGVHLVGFTAALFTLIQTTQHPSDWGISKIFNLEMPPALANIGEIVLPYLFSLVIWFLLFFTIWTIFRFAVFAHYAEQLKTVKPADISKREEAIHQAIHVTVEGKLSRKHLYWVFPARHFIESGTNRQHWWGRTWCFILSIVTTLFLIGLLW